MTAYLTAMGIILGIALLTALGFHQQALARCPDPHPRSRVAVIFGVVLAWAAITGLYMPGWL